jgi:hypothetical protein
MAILQSYIRQVLTPMYEESKLAPKDPKRDLTKLSMALANVVLDCSKAPTHKMYNPAKLALSRDFPRKQTGDQGGSSWLRR